jgi:hypothetical protein
MAGLDALHVGEDHGGDIQAGIEGWSIRIERPFAVPEFHGEATRGCDSDAKDVSEKKVTR